MNRLFLSILSGTVACFSLSCASGDRQSHTSDTDAVADTAATENGWVSLFNGSSLEGWHGFNQTTPVSNWIVEDGVLTCLGKESEGTHPDLVTDKEYENFELEWEWKISPGGNGGVLYDVVESDKYKAPSETGPEYQLIDDIGYPGKLEDWQKTGANYAMNLPDTTKKELKPVGEWNSSKIVYDHGHVEHWLNGQKIVEFQERTDEWNNNRDSGKWKDYPDYKSVDKGRIALQDHGDRTWFRNIRIRELN